MQELNSKAAILLQLWVLNFNFIAINFFTIYFVDKIIFYPVAAR